MNMSAAINAGDLASSFDHFTHAVSVFATAIANIGWGYLAAGLLLALAANIARAHAWANALRAAYPDGRVHELRVVASFLAGAGLNAALPARGCAARVTPRSNWPEPQSSGSNHRAGMSTNSPRTNRRESGRRLYR